MIQCRTMDQPQLSGILGQSAGSTDAGTFLVLASGGVDSSTLLWLLAEQDLAPSALFVDYGQAAAEAESAAVARVCKAVGAPLRNVGYSGMSFGSGEIRGRNAYLLHTALIEFPASSGVVALGIHAGTGYADCSPEFVDVMQRSYDFHTGGAINIVAPFLNWTKQQVYALAGQLDVPLEQTYSCESASRPCGKCRSCLDRGVLAVRSVAC